jgi:integration host factor subunit beta
MTKSELIERISQKQSQLAYRDVELAVKTILEHMAERLANGERIEIRGFGSFSLHYRPGRVGRNPKTGTPVSLPAKHVPHFKPGKELRERVDESFRRELERGGAEMAVGSGSSLSSETPASSGGGSPLGRRGSHAAAAAPVAAVKNPVY